MARLAILLLLAGVTLAEVWIVAAVPLLPECFYVPLMPVFRLPRWQFDVVQVAALGLGLVSLWLTTSLGYWFVAPSIAWWHYWRGTRCSLTQILDLHACAPGVVELHLATSPFLKAARARTGARDASWAYASVLEGLLRLGRFLEQERCASRCGIRHVVAYIHFVKPGRLQQLGFHTRPLEFSFGKRILVFFVQYEMIQARAALGWDRTLKGISGRPALVHLNTGTEATATTDEFIAMIPELERRLCEYQLHRARVHDRAPRR